jgi:nucleoid DNA-binding protein
MNDKEKLMAWIASFNQTNNPFLNLKSKEAYSILNEAFEKIETALQDAEEKTEGLP